MFTLSRLLKFNRLLLPWPLQRFSLSFDDKKDYYKTLGVPSNTPAPDLKKAYFQLAKKYHPDIAGNKGTAKFKEISEAYEVVGDESLRQQYDYARKAYGRTD